MTDHIMAFLFKPLLCFLLVAQTVAGLELEFDAATCGEPVVITTSRITTITYEQTITFSRTCHTSTVTTPSSGAGCPDLKTCGPYPMCVEIETTTAYIPPSDPCCVSTPTATITGPCATCQTGCATSTSTVYITTSAPTPSSTLQARDTLCATTVWRSSLWNSGPTTTYHPLTQTRTSLVKCNGCSLVISDLNGVGPVISPTVTVTDTAPLVLTTYACL